MELSDRSSLKTVTGDLCYGLALAVVLLGLVVLFGWYADMEWLRRPVPGTVAMNPATALCFIFCGMAVLTRDLRWHQVPLTFAFFALALAVVKIVALLFGADSWVDTFLFTDSLEGEVAGVTRNRMAPNTATGFVLAAGSLLIHQVNDGRKSAASKLAEYVAIVVFVLSLISILGYLYQAEEFYGVLKFIPMAVHTAVGFLMLSVSILCTRPNAPFMGVLLGPLEGSRIMRLLLPIALLGPIVLGTLRLWGQQVGLFSQEIGVTMAILVEVSVLVLFVWKVGRSTNRVVEQRLAHAQAQEALNAKLEGLVSERTAALQQQTKELERKLKELSDYQYALDQGSIVAMTDDRGMIKHVNDNFCRVSGYSREELVGKSHRIVNSGYHPKEFFADLWATIQRGDIWRGVIRNKQKNGKFYWMDTTIVPFLGADGLPERYMAIRSGLTELKEAESKVRRLNATLEQKVKKRTAQLEAANKELESFSYSVSHDLRAPLRAVNGFSEMLEQEHGPQLNDDAKRLLDIIKTNAVNMGRLIDDLLEFSRTGRKELRSTSVDMNALVASVLDESVQTTDNRAKVTVEDLPAAHCDPQLVRNVWVNLLSNALKYSSKREEPVISVRGEQLEEGVVYHVADNGAGFNSEYADKLFGVFQRLHSTAEFEGTGVGLAIVNRIVTKHGGEVWAESEVDQGATFHFSIPNEQNEENQE